MANENQNLLLAGIIQMIVTLIPFLRRAGHPELAAELEAITARADANYQSVIDVADERLGDS
jgi:hypothetical protein